MKKDSKEKRTIEDWMKEANKQERQGDMEKAEEAWKEAAHQSLREENFSRAVDLAIQSGDEEFIADIKEKKKERNRKERESIQKKNDPDIRGSHPSREEKVQEKKEAGEEEKLKKFLATRDILQKELLSKEAKKILSDLERIQGKIQAAVNTQIMEQGGLDEQTKKEYADFREVMGMDEREELEQLEERKQKGGLLSEEKERYGELKRELGADQANELSDMIKDIHKESLAGKDVSVQEEEFRKKAEQLGVFSMEKLGELEDAIKKKKENGEEADKEEGEYKDLKKRLGIKEVEKLASTLGLIRSPSDL